MFGLIEGWLFNRLGVNCNFKKIEESTIFQDGCVLVNILQSYGLVDDKFSASIQPTTKIAECKRNLKLLKPMFDMLKIKYNETIINEIVDIKAGTTINLLYELYICLENKQHLYFITKQNFEEVYRDNVKNLPSVTVNETLQKHEQSFSSDVCLEQPLIHNADVVKWYKDKYHKITDKLNAKLNLSKRQELHNEVIDKKQICEPCLPGRKFTINLEHLEDLPGPNAFLKSSGNENLLDYEDFIARFKFKQNSRAVKKNFENAMQHELLQSTWRKIEEKENKIYNSVLSAVLLKQSSYEKQIVTKLVQAQKETNVQRENKIWAKQSVINEQLQETATDIELKGNFEMLEQNYKSEQKRVLELHKKLYKEKKEITKRVNHDICKDIVDAIIELAISAAEYKSKNKMEVSKSLWKDWVQLFIKSQPIRSQLQTLEDDILSGKDVDYDEAISFEKEQDEVLNEIYIDEYLLTRGVWFHSSVFLEHPDLNENYLAAIIYRLLSLKYPLPPSSPAPELPSFKITGVLLNLNSPDSVQLVKLLLTKPGVHVFDTDLAVKKCIDQFQIETQQFTAEKIKGKEKGLKNQTKKSSKQQSSEKKKASQDKSRKKSAKTNKARKLEQSLKSTDDIVLTVVNKETQTSIFSEAKEEETKRTSLGLLGENIYNMLKEGVKLDNPDMASVIVEYIKTLEEFDGWILLNYPTTIEQAYNLELALTAKKIPLEQIDSEEISVLPDEELDKWSEKRKSRLLNYPLSESDTQTFESYFKIFVNIVPKENRASADVNEIIDIEDPISVKETELKGVVDAPSYLLNQFYSKLSIYKNFYLKTPDPNNLKRLARVILKEDSIEPKPSIELFGEETLNKLVKGKKSLKKGKPSKTDNNLKPKGKVKNKDKKSDLINKGYDVKLENTAVVDTATNQSETDPEKSSYADDINLLPINPSKQKYSNVTFLSLPLNQEFGVLLATMWENIETCYIESLKNVLFENRVINLRLHPYCMYLKKEINTVINTPDLKQSIINSFQEYFNNISDELRTISEMKFQLHCRVLEMQQNLWEITDERKQEVEGKRQDLINENWLVNEICLLINNFLYLIEIELDRSLQTLQLISDYYLNMLGKTPPISKTRLEIEKVGRINVEILLNSIHKLSGEITVIENRDSNKDFKSNFIANSLIYCLDEQKFIDILEKILLEKIKGAKSNFNSFLQIYQTQNKSEAILKAKSNKEVSKEQSPKSKKKEKSKNKSSVNSGQTEQDIQKKMSMNDLLIEEWKSTIDAEAERLDFRIDLIYQRAKENIVEFYCFLEAVFCDISKSILSKYNTDITNINAACEYLRVAIEEESSLHHHLVLGQNNFFVSIKDNVDNTGCSVLRELEEEAHECLFTVQQLNQLVKIFQTSAPLGVIRKQPLCFIIQDLMLLDSYDNHPYLPKIWNSLDELDLRYVIDGIFGPEFAVDWKDFIIYNLDIPYPDVQDILSLRNKFLSYDPEETELISPEDYENVTLWFENDLPDSPEQTLRFALVKRLLSEMFQVDETHTNYTALLLYFCKDVNPINGFKKALSLSLGKNVIVTKAELDMVLQNEEEVNGIICSILTEIIDCIVLTRESAQVNEVIETPSRVSFSESIEEDSSIVSLSNFSKYLSMEAFNTNPELHPRLCDEKSTSKTSILSTPCITKSWISKIPISSAISVLNASFFYQDRRLTLKTQYLSGLEDVVDANGMIEAFDFVNLTNIQRLFAMTNKFKISRPCDKVRECLTDI